MRLTLYAFAGFSILLAFLSFQLAVSIWSDGGLFFDLPWIHWFGIGVLFVGLAFLFILVGRYIGAKSPPRPAESIGDDRHLTESHDIYLVDLGALTRSGAALIVASFLIALIPMIFGQLLAFAFPRLAEQLLENRFVVRFGKILLSGICFLIFTSSFWLGKQMLHKRGLKIFKRRSR